MFITSFLLQGTFVLQDNRFRWLAHMSVDPSVETTGSIQDPSAMAENRAAQATGLHLYFPCGIIRGALSNLGIPCAVSADISNLPACELITLLHSRFFFFGSYKLQLRQNNTIKQSRGNSRSIHFLILLIKLFLVIIDWKDLVSLTPNN